MGHRCKYFDRLEIEDNKLVRIITATYNKNSLDVYKEYEDGEFKARNIYFSSLAGYLVNFPGEKVRVPYSSIIELQVLENWYSTCECNISCSYSNIFDKEEILLAKPEFKYLILKYNDSNLGLLMKLIKHYKKFPNIEPLVEKGLYSLALNTNLQKLSKEKLFQIISFIKANEGFSEYTKLIEIQRCIKNKIPYKFYKHFLYCKDDNKLLKYLINKNIDLYYYIDYITMAKKAGHDVTDLYWKMPNNIFIAHDKVMEENKNIEKAKQYIMQGLLSENTKHLQKFNKNVDGFDIFIPNDISDILKACDVLKQCLVTGGYINKMINQEEILVFIWKNGQPLATAQVYFDKSVGQFYGDESRHKIDGEESCRPSEEVSKVFYKWLETFKPKKKKFIYKQKFYKGFIKKDGEFYIGFNDFKFKIGVEYETLYSNDEIYIAGGSGCSATEKVFHFCDNINEIFKHYNPSKELICEIEPLGALVEHNGAYLSNKIKIIRQLSKDELDLAFKMI